MTQAEREARLSLGPKTSRTHCPLCEIPPSEVLFEFGKWKLVRTKTMKGHRERLMLFYRSHVRNLDEGSVGEAYALFMRLGTKFFAYTDRWAIFDPDFATVPDHWHRVASDLDDKAEDYDQILRTPRTIIENHEGTVTRVLPQKGNPAN